MVNSTEVPAVQAPVLVRRRPVASLAMVICRVGCLVGCLVGFLASCAGDPAEVAERGRAEVERHAASEWVRLTHDGLLEISYETRPAEVPPNEGGVLEFTFERPTQFIQEFSATEPPDRALFVAIREALVGRGAEALGVTCELFAEDLERWHLAVAESGDWLAITLIERAEGLAYEVTVRDSRPLEHADRECPVEAEG